MLLARFHPSCGSSVTCVPHDKQDLSHSTPNVRKSWDKGKLWDGHEKLARTSILLQSYMNKAPYRYRITLCQFLVPSPKLFLCRHHRRLLPLSRITQARNSFEEQQLYQYRPVLANSVIVHADAGVC